MSDNIYYVYIYYDHNNIPRYVGKGCNGRDTFHIKACQQESDKNKHPAFYEWLREQQDHNIPYTHWRMAENLTEPEAHDLEIGCIAEYGRLDLGTGTLTNLTDGGEGVSGRVVSEEERKVKSARIAAWRDKLTAANLARWAAMSEEEKQAWGEAKSARWAAMSEEDRQARGKAISARWAAKSEEEKQAWGEAISARWAAMSEKDRQAMGDKLTAANLARWAAMSEEDRQARGKAISARWAAKSEEEKQAWREAISATKASKILGFKVSFNQIRLGYQLLTGNELILTRRFTCRKATQELIDTFGHQRVTTVLTGIVERATVRRVESIPVENDRRSGKDRRNQPSTAS